MSLTNIWFFIKTIIDWAAIEAATRNQYRIVGIRPYSDKKGKLPDGFSMTLQVMYDDFDYGIDKNGNPRENNVFQNFDVTVLSRQGLEKAKKGDIIQLFDFDSENSYAINFDMILRFKSAKILQPQGNGNVKPNA